MYFVMKFRQMAFGAALLKTAVAYRTVRSAPDSDRKIWLTRAQGSPAPRVF